MELTIKDLKELFYIKSDLSTIDELIGKNVFIRTITHHYCGYAITRDSMFLKLAKASWVADDGRLSESMKDASEFVEVEMYTNPICINLYSILDVGELSGKLPEETK